MKAFLCTVLALCSSCACLCAAVTEPPRAAYGFEQVEVIKRIAEWSQKGSYAEIYKVLAPEYTSGISEPSFVGVLRHMSWKLENVRPGSLEEYAAISYMPVRADVIRSGRLTMKVDVVVFFKKTAAGWRLINFPFATPDLLPFNSVLDWFLGDPTGLPTSRGGSVPGRH